ncbi:alpha-amylase family glycosyl hydrolase [Staphylococcus aureus]
MLSGCISDFRTEVTRDSRTPTQWSDDVNAGFTAGSFWIDISENYHQVNVREALQNKDSIFYTIKN